MPSTSVKAYWRKEHEKLIGIVANVPIIGIDAVGPYAPAVILRLTNGECVYFGVRETALLHWHLGLWLGEKGATGRLIGN
jgi:hypothetical protein